MTALNGYLLPPNSPTSASNPMITDDIDAFPIWYYNPNLSEGDGPLTKGLLTRHLPGARQLEAKPGFLLKSFFEDFYFRVQLAPLEIDLGTVASTQTRQVRVWNAWPDQNANLINIGLSDPAGITITGQTAPYTMPPLRELTYNVSVATSGPAQIDVDLSFDFSNVADPIPVHITGSRAIKFDIIPEVPVEEDWEWKTDVQTATDGSEQRIALRGGMPRISQSIQVLFDANGQVRQMLGQLLTAVGRLWIPQFQYALPVANPSALGDARVYYDPTRTDIRVGEYLMIQTPTGGSVLMGVLSLNADGANLAGSLTIAVPLKSIIIPGCSSLLEDKSSLARYAVDAVGSIDLTCHMLWDRTTLVRPGGAATLNTYLGFPILDKRPTAEKNVKDSVYTGQVDIDNDTGKPDIVSRWDYSRMDGERSWLVNRVASPALMDYWKTFLDYCRGQCNKFWMPSYRKDFQVTTSVPVAANAFSLDGIDYAENFFTLPTHRYLQIFTNAGMQNVQVTLAEIVDGASQITFTPALPSGAGWNIIQYVSFLLPCRLSNDKVVWKHTGLNSTIDMSVRTAE